MGRTADVTTTGHHPDPNREREREWYDPETKGRVEQIANAACRGFAYEGSEFRVNPATGVWETRVVDNAFPCDDPNDAAEEQADEPLPSRCNPGDPVTHRRVTHDDGPLLLPRPTVEGQDEAGSFP